MIIHEIEIIEHGIELEILKHHDDTNEQEWQIHDLVEIIEQHSILKQILYIEIDQYQFVSGLMLIQDEIGAE